MSPTKVTKADVEAKLRQIQNKVEEDTEAAKPSAIRIAVVVAVGVVVVVFWLGKRRGRLRSTVVEVRRV